MNSTSLHLFQGFGIELEYMLVRTSDLSVLPMTDQVLKAVAGEITEDVERDDLCWSNEIVLHLIELKTNGPAPALEGIEKSFHKDIKAINAILASHGGMLMPTAMHPTMDPVRETVLWPHGYSAVYHTYNRIFSCQGHGWSNLQSMHLNLPFAGDDEFGRLHAAIRLLLPIIPALTAASPIIEGKSTGFLDYRLEVYRKNQIKIPQLTGAVIPEPVFTIRDYESEILERCYQAIKPLDSEGLMQEEWLNSRGAIARFERNAIEIRIIDIQEAPSADVAIAALVASALKHMVSEDFTSYEMQKAWQTDALASIFLKTIEHADEAMIHNPDYLRAVGFNGAGPVTAGELWKYLFNKFLGEPSSNMNYFQKTLSTIVEKGPLARRILRRTGLKPSKTMIHDVYRELCSCLAEDRLFLP